jgi:hypothetical protein
MPGDFQRIVHGSQGRLKRISGAAGYSPQLWQMIVVSDQFEAGLRRGQDGLLSSNGVGGELSGSEGPSDTVREGAGLGFNAPFVGLVDAGLRPDNPFVAVREDAGFRSDNPFVAVSEDAGLRSDNLFVAVSEDAVLRSDGPFVVAIADA